MSTETAEQPAQQPVVEFPFGLNLLKQIDPDAAFLNEDQRASIAQIEHAEALKAMLYADLSDTHPLNMENAERVFGSLLRSFQLPQILMKWRFFLLSQCQSCIDSQTQLMADKTLTGEERVNAGKSRVEAVKAMNMLLERATSLAKIVGALKVPRDRSKPKNRPKNAPPSLGG